MNRYRLQLVRGLRRLGTAGTLGVLLLAYAVAQAGFSLLPAVQRERELEQRLAQREAAIAAERLAREQAGDNSPQARLTQFYQGFPAQETLPEWLEKIYALAAEQSLTLEQAQYKLAPEASGRLARYEITVPANGRYPQLRRFIERALADLPALALRDLRFKRDGIDRENVDAMLQFVFYVRTG